MRPDENILSLIRKNQKKCQKKLKKPPWLKIKPPSGEFSNIKQTLESKRLVTVCQEAHCPNQSECWTGGTATFMVLGGTCTRGCKFCMINTAANGEELDKNEPRKIAEAVRDWGLKYVVITSVDRDDLEDQGSDHFAECIKYLKKESPETLVEVLIPDFQGRMDLLQNIVDAKPDVIAHNIETVRRLSTKIRDKRANYDQSLKVIKAVKDKNPNIISKSGLMVGLGETKEEVSEAMDDLRKIGCEILTIGQYLRPSEWHLLVEEYISPETFKYYEKIWIRKR